MRDIHCPKDIGFENTFIGEDCQKEQFYNNCYHCWTTALAKSKAPEQVPFMNKPCVAHQVCHEDKVKVLDKIRAEIEKQEKWLLQDGYTIYNVDIAFNTIKAVITESEG